MKNYKMFLLAITATISILASCKKDKTEPTELSKLPAATQIGANTFGCLVNGKAWVAKRNDCFIICSSSFKIYYDGSSGGYFGIEAVKIDTKNNISERIDVFFDSSNFKTEHIVTINNPLITVRFANYSNGNNCSNYQHNLDSTVVHFGKVNFTRYDLSNGIFSGTFNFTLTKPGCETITITEGRFDKKL